MITRPPGPKGHFLLGSLPDFGADQLGFLRRQATDYGDIVYMRLAHLHVYLLAQPEAIREVLVTQSAKFEKAPLDKKILGKFLGNGLLTSDGDFHRRQRRLAQPAFHTGRIQAYADVMVAYAQQLIAGWQPGQARDVAADMMHLTMQIVSKTLFDADAVTGRGNTAETIGQAMHHLQAVTNHDYRRGFSPPDWLPTPDNRRRRKAVAAFNVTMERIIDERQATAVDGTITDTGDLLSMLMLAQDEDGSVMDDRQLRDEVATLFAAGHETTSNALSWTWYLLAQHPKAEAKLHQELDTVLSGRSPALDDLPNLPYALMVIKEALRLYPPAWLLNGRIALEDVTISGYTLPKNSIAFISPYVMHHLPATFPDPDQFRPERFTPEREKALPRYAYIPFGGGPRICIGNAFALMEAHLILATIAQRFRLSLLPGHTVIPDPQITLSPQGGLPMMVEERVVE